MKNVFQQQPPFVNTATSCAPLAARLGKRRSRRRGIAVVIIMTMITVAFAISYSMLRLQSTAMLVHQNAERRTNARQTAMAGIAAGLRRIHLNSWAGVGSSFAINPSSTETCVVSYVAGDSSLVPGQPDYSNWHYRVTITASAMALSPVNSQVQSRHTARAVVHLVPRRVGDAPASWSDVRSNTIYQTRSAPFTVNLPVRVEGSLRLQGPIQLGSLLSWTDSARLRYLDDLNLMRTGRNEIQVVTVQNATGGTYQLRFDGATTSPIAHNASATTVRNALRNLSTIGNGNVTVTGPSGGQYRVTFTGALATQNATQILVASTSLSPGGATVSTTTEQNGAPGYGDYRPFTGPIAFPQSGTDAFNRQLLDTQQIIQSNIAVSSAMSLPLPTSLTSYRIYSGGPTYTIPQLPSNLSNTSRIADPETNPLGIFFAPGSITINNNVTLAGTLICGGSVTLAGNNVNFQPVNLPPLVNTAEPIRLPAVLARENVAVDAGANVAVNGFVVAGDRFEVSSTNSDTSLLLEGRVVTGEFVIRPTGQWNVSSFIWGWIFSLFGSQADGDTGTPYFPVYLALWGRSPVPTLTLRPNPDSLSEHWQDLTGPIYLAHGGDPGLVWDVIRIEHD